MRAVIIVNPYSSGITSKRERAIVTTLREYLDLEVQRTQRPGHAGDLAAAAVDAGADLIIACGGDGTGNEVLNGMSLGEGTAADRPLFALLPAGATNVLCRSLGLPNDPVKAARQLVTAFVARRASTVNLGMFDERLFMFAAGIGLDGEVVKRIDARRNGRRPGDLAHTVTLIGVFAQQRFVLKENMTVTVDDTGETFRAGMLMCGNAAPFSYMGKLPLNFMPDTELDKGLDIMAPEKVTPWIAIRNSIDATGVLRGRLAMDPSVKRVRHDIARFTVVCDEPTGCQVDGEYVGDRTHIEVRTVPRAVRMVH